MKKFTPAILFLLAIVGTVLSLFGEDGYPRLTSLRQDLHMQREKNAELEARVKELRREIISIEKSDRSLEKRARNELGLARQGEVIFIFDRYAEAGE